MELKISKTIEAVQYTAGAFGLTKVMGTLSKYGKWNAAQIEVCLSADEKLAYYSYGSQRPKHWIGLVKYFEADPKPDIFMGGWVGFTPKDGTPPYWRAVYPFAFYEIKSKASVTRDWAPVYLDTKDKEAVTNFHDFAQLEEWQNPIPQCVEFRTTGGGRGFIPHYVYDTEWLVVEPLATPDRDGHTFNVRVLKDSEMAELKAA